MNFMNKPKGETGREDLERKLKLRRDCDSGDLDYVIINVEQ